MHVDEKLPGDRLSSCLSLMEPIGVNYHSQKGQQITHECVQCHAKSINKVADDDNMDLIIKLINRTNVNQSNERQH
jgi:hypothetical protein